MDNHTLQRYQLVRMIANLLTNKVYFDGRGIMMTSIDSTYRCSCCSMISSCTYRIATARSSLGDRYYLCVSCLDTFKQCCYQLRGTIASTCSLYDKYNPDTHHCSVTGNLAGLYCETCYQHVAHYIVYLCDERMMLCSDCIHSIRIQKRRIVWRALIAHFITDVARHCYRTYVLLIQN